MQVCGARELWMQFLKCVEARCSKTAFGNWLSPIEIIEATEEKIVLGIPNIFVREYLLSNYKKELCAFLPVRHDGEPAVEFVVQTEKKTTIAPVIVPIAKAAEPIIAPHEVKLNSNYRFESFIEGPATQFVKSAAIGVASRPGHSYNPLFIHGGVGLGKTHLLHSIGHFIREKNPKMKVHCITTEAFINDLVDSLRNKSVDKMKRFYRNEVDVLLVDDIQFPQNLLHGYCPNS